MAQYRKDTNVYLNQEKTLFEVVGLYDRISPSGTATDAFGRLRVSNPLTLFDSQNRYQVNDRFSTSNTGSANANTSYIVHQSAINLNVGTPATDSVKRETKRVFAYQPGKSLLIMNTFAMANAQANLTQRVGYFNTDNGIFLEKSNNDVYLVLRSNSTGTIQETKVAQANWNKDVFDGTANSFAAAVGHGGLDTTKTNIFWTDVEWLGVGDVRCGFVVDGLMVPAHIFHNDNLRTEPYMTTACLPIRYEIFNTGVTANNSTLKQICSTVVSEGGYTLEGKARSISIPITSPRDLPTAGTFTPVLSVRLKDSFKDAIAVLKDVEFFGVTNNTSYRYKIIIGGTLTDASWVSAASDSPIEYDITASAISGGRDAQIGYVNVSAGAGGAAVNLGRETLFAYQFERDPFAASNSGIIITLAATGAANGNDGVGAMTWEEIV